MKIINWFNRNVFMREEYLSQELWDWIRYVQLTPSERQERIDNYKAARWIHKPDDWPDDWKPNTD